MDKTLKLALSVLAWLYAAVIATVIMVTVALYLNWVAFIIIMPIMIAGFIYVLEKYYG